MSSLPRHVSRVLVVASIGWPLLLASAAWSGDGGHRAAWSPLVYLAASRVCHQKAERSFQTAAGVQWPVCARCSGLYLAAPVGAVAASLLRRRRTPLRSVTPWLALAAAPSATSFALEFLTTVPIGNVVRLVAALPLGAAVAFVVVAVATAEPAEPIEYTRRA